MRSDLQTRLRAAAGVVLLLLSSIQGSPVRTSARAVSLGDPLARIDRARVRGVTLAGRQIVGHFAEGRDFRTYASPGETNIVEKLTADSVAITAKAPRDEDVGPILLVANNMVLLYFCLPVFVCLIWAFQK